MHQARRDLVHHVAVCGQFAAGLFVLEAVAAVCAAVAAPAAAGGAAGAGGIVVLPAISPAVGLALAVAALLASVAALAVATGARSAPSAAAAGLTALLGAALVVHVHVLGVPPVHPVLQVVVVGLLYGGIGFLAVAALCAALVLRRGALA